MKSIGYVMLTSGAVGCSLLAAGGCSSSGQGTDSSSGDQVQGALNQMSPFPSTLPKLACLKAIRQCVDSSCHAQEEALLSAAPFSQAALNAIRALQKCAKDSCADACIGGTGGASSDSGSGGGPASGGATHDGGVEHDGGAGKGGSTSSSGGGPASGGATHDGGVHTGGKTSSSGGGPASGGATHGGGTTGAGGTGGAAPSATGGCAGNWNGGATSAGGTTHAGGATAGGGTTGAGGTTSAGGSPPTGGIDLTGTWISHVNAAGTISAPVVGSTAANIDIVIRLAVTAASGGGYSGTLQICRLDPVTTPATALVVTFSPAVISTLQTGVTIPSFMAAVGAAVPVPPTTIMTGENSAGMSVDSDSDGNPGVTIPANVGGLIMLNAYAGLTINTALNGTLTNATTITGTASFTSTGTVFGSNNPVLTSGSIDVTPSSSAIPFTATKLAGNVPCTTVASMF